MVVRGVAGRESTIIDCEHVLETRGFNIDSGETRAMIIEGFTILRGYPISVGEGGGIRIADSSPTLRSLRIEDCISGSGHYNPYGGGLYSVGGAPFISDVELIENMALFGVGAYVSGAAVLEDIVAMGNDGLTGMVYMSTGGGLSLAGPCTLRQSVIRDNLASIGGGLRCYGDVRIEECIIAGNTGYEGAGISLRNGTTVEACTVVGNDGGGYPLGGVIHKGDGEVDCAVRRTVVAYNTADIFPFLASEGTLTVEDCCMYGNKGGDVLDVDEGVDSDGGNVVADPLFCDFDGGDYGIAWNSPCSPERAPGGQLVGALPPACAEVPSFACIANSSGGRAGSVRVLHASGGFIDEFAVGDDVRSCTAAADGSVWVASAGTQELIHLSPEGAELGAAALASAPGEVAMDRVGDAWVVLPGSNSVARVDSGTSDVLTYPVGTDPVAIVADHDGDVWVANAGSDDVTQVDGETGAGEAFAAGLDPAGIVIDHENAVWMALGLADAVAKLDGEGALVGTYPVGDEPGAMAVDLAGRVWVACRSSHEIVCLDSGGAVVDSCSFDLPSAADPVSLAIDRNDRLWVLDGAQHEVRIYSMDGSLLGTGDAGAAPVDLAIGTACPSTSVPGDAPMSGASLAFSISPNPVRSSRAMLALSLPAGARDAVITVYDVAGRVVREARVAGRGGEGRATWVWDCLDSSGVPVASGVYFCRVAAGAEEASEKVVVVR